MFRRKSGSAQPPAESGVDTTPTSKRLFKLQPKRPPPPSPSSSFSHSSSFSSLPSVDESSLELVLAQAQCTREEGMAALRECPDVVDALMLLSERRQGNYDNDTDRGRRRDTVDALSLLCSTGAPEDLARQALAKHQGDIVEALLSLNNAVLVAVESDDEQVANDNVDSDEDVMGFAAKIHQQLKLHHRKSVNVSAMTTARKDMTRRDMIEQELESSERVYLSGVEKLQVYVEHLASTKTLEEARKCFQALLVPLKLVVVFHKNLLQSFSSKIAVSDALAHMNQLEQPYGDVIEIIQGLLPRLDEWDGKGSLKTSLKDRGSMSDFQSHLIMPVQRIPRYQLFLRDLLKCYEPTDEEFGRLRDCLQKVEIVNRAINKRLANCANRQRMIGLSSQFASDPNLLTNTRLLEKEGFVKEKKEKRKLFLFNDLFVVAVKSGSKLKVLEKHPLETVRCFSTGGEDDEFSIRFKTTNSEATYKCESMQEQLEWMQAITNGVATVLNAKAK